MSRSVDSFSEVQLIRNADNTWLKSICLDAVGYSFPICLLFSFLHTHTESTRARVEISMKNPCCCRFSFFHSQRVKAQLSRDQFTEKFPSFSLAEIFAQLDFLEHWVLLKATWHGRFPASVHDIYLERRLAKLVSPQFLLPQNNSLWHFTKSFHLKHERCACKPGDRLNRATASEKLKMMWNFPSAFSRVPNRHSQRPLSNFPHAHTATSLRRISQS